MPEPNTYDRSSGSNPVNEVKDALSYINRSVSDRRDEFLPQALASTEDISTGRGQYQEYQTAVTTLLSKPGDETAQNTVREYRFFVIGDRNRLNNVSFSNIEIPRDIADQRQDVILENLEDTKAIEKSITQAIAQDYGNFLAAIEAGDVQTSINLLVRCPDLAYQPENCQQLEALIESQFINNPEIVFVSNIPYDSFGKLQAEKRPFLDVICQQTQKRQEGGWEPGDLSSINNLYPRPFSGSLPETSKSSLDQIFSIAEIAKGYNRQMRAINGTERQPGHNNDQIYRQDTMFSMFRNDLLGMLDRNYVGAVSPENRRIILDQLYKPNISGKYHEKNFVAGNISEFIKSDSFSLLPEKVQQGIRLEFLGRCLALAETIKNKGDQYRELRIPELSNILTAVATSKNLAPNPENSNLEAKLLQKIIGTARDTSFQQGESIQNDLTEYAQKMQSEIDSKKAKEEEDHRVESKKIADIEAETNRIAEKFKTQMSALQEIDQPSPETLLSSIALEIQNQIKTDTQAIINGIQKSEKGILFLKKQGYTTDDVLSIQKQLKAIPTSEQLVTHEIYNTNDQKIQLEIHRRALEKTLKYLKNNLLS